MTTEITFVIEPGANDITIDGVSMNAVDAFRAECLSGGAVSCDWDTLHARLISRDVSSFWWFLEEAERRSIVSVVVGYTFPYKTTQRRIGLPDCSGGVGGWEAADCTANAIIAYFKLISTSVEPRDDTWIDEWYWKNLITGDEHCYAPNPCFWLPGHFVNCYNWDKDFHHSLCAIQVSPTTENLCDWVVFQYGVIDIHPGNWQMLAGSTVHMYDLTAIGWDFSNGDIIASFYDVQ